MSILAQNALIYNPDTTEPPRGLPFPSILDLSSEGFSIIPIERGTKRPPDGFRWKPYQERAASREQVQEWQETYLGCNWGAVWGPVSGNIMSIDIDSAAGFGWCQAQGGFNQEDPVWYTTGRGWQYLYRLPAELADKGVLLPHEGVELRVSRCYSIIPPSIHPSGRAYTWKRFGEIPFVPDWVLGWLYGHPTIRRQGYTRDNPTGERDRGPTKATRSTAATVRPASAKESSRRRDPHRAQLTGNSNPRILDAPGYQWLWDRTFPTGSRHNACTSIVMLLRLAGVDQDQAKRSVDKWRKNCTRPMYSEREARYILDSVYRISYGVTVEGLRKATDSNGECMSEGDALALTRLLPSPRKRRSARRHDPMFASVARILLALEKEGAFLPTPIAHSKLTELTGLTVHRVAKAAPFLTLIGVRTVEREGSSNTSTYSLNHLKASPAPLIKDFARWRGYKWSWQWVAKWCWRRMRGLMKKVLSHLNNVWNRIVDTWQGERGCGVDPLQRVALEEAVGRGPPT